MTGFRIISAAPLPSSLPAAPEVVVEPLDTQHTRYTFAFREPETGLLRGLHVVPNRLSRAAHYWDGLARLTLPPEPDDVVLEGESLNVPFSVWRAVLRDVHEFEDFVLHDNELVAVYYLLDFLDPIESTRSGRALMAIMEACIARIAQITPEQVFEMLAEAMERGPATLPVQNALAKRALAFSVDEFSPTRVTLAMLSVICALGVEQNRAPQALRLFAAWCEAQENSLSVQERAAATELLPAFLDAGVSPCTLERLRLAPAAEKTVPKTLLRTFRHESIRRAYSHGITRLRADAQHVVSACYDSGLRVWDLATGREVASWDAGFNNVWLLELTPKVIVTSGHDWLCVWDRSSAVLLWQRQFRYDALVSATVLGDVLFIGDPFSGRIDRLDVLNGEALAPWNTGGEAAIRMKAYDNTIVSMDKSGHVKVLADNTCVQELALPHPYKFAELKQADADAVLMTYDQRHTVVWDRVSDRLLHRFYGVPIALTKAWVVTHTDGELWVWDRATGEQLHSIKNKAWVKAGAAPTPELLIFGNDAQDINVWACS